MEKVEVYLQWEWVMPLIKWHHRRMKKDGITPKELEVIGKRVGITANTRGAYEQHLKTLAKKGYVRKLTILREGCRIIELTDKGTEIYDRLPAMKILPVVEKRKRVKSAVKVGKVTKAIAAKAVKEVKAERLAKADKITKRDAILGMLDKAQKFNELMFDEFYKIIDVAWPKQ